MDRLTIRNSDGSVSQPLNLNWAAALERLAACEDTGLDPVEAAAIENALVGRMVAKLTEFCGVPVERLEELARAEKDGRLVVLPFKIGDFVYRIAIRKNT